MPQQYPIQVLDERGNKVKTVYLTQKELDEQGLTKESKFHAVTHKNKSGKVQTFYIPTTGRTAAYFPPTKQESL